jgi:hypothetical protein
MIATKSTPGPRYGRRHSSPKLLPLHRKLRYYLITRGRRRPRYYLVKR